MISIGRQREIADVNGKSYLICLTIHIYYILFISNMRHISQFELKKNRFTYANKMLLIKHNLLLLFKTLYEFC